MTESERTCVPCTRGTLGPFTTTNQAIMFRPYWLRWLDIFSAVPSPTTLRLTCHGPVSKQQNLQPHHPTLPLSKYTTMAKLGRAIVSTPNHRTPMYKLSTTDHRHLGTLDSMALRSLLGIQRHCVESTGQVAGGECFQELGSQVPG
jgi:hypothetical protein